jgi:hypothetical protein
MNARIAANPEDISAVLHKYWATAGPYYSHTDNDLYPNWNPTPVLDLLPIA